ncbi:MAG: dTDP-4-dehydrorhamnose reductase [Bacteroidetes bacterium]|nr:dTDP-4-dehydrorhamnose reductase [Rhodothermia bacterium]MCS7155488.1 dTDP-4-dehydrorhamnose reductase [Bacteroidota bacterium]MCX7907419.1 dTDP-4-dehydrorhamnose reductase [Bacteroidota bacterium]MDW8138413.1 dTDP-4-dehydrorhamnose reductase [Bacteroidota bacterium]MDW8284650.1 dTDP-4-dehydrorhamnose reductase [Bacteroidota bacterium]
MSLPFGDILPLRVLITGANGLVGQRLVEAFARYARYDVLATGRDAQPRFGNLGAGYVRMDVLKRSDIEQVFADFTPHVVVHAAAMTNVDACERDRALCWRTNVQATQHIVRACERYDSKLVFLSTDFVFDGRNGPYREDDPPNPINYYGACKLTAENEVRASLVDWAIVRTALVYGTAQRLERPNIALWVIERLRRGERLRVVVDQYRTPTYNVDLARGIERLVRLGARGIYHLSGRELLSVYDFARCVAEAFDLDPDRIEPCRSEQLGQYAPRPPRTGFVILKAETELGYRPRSLREALRELRQQLEPQAA